MEKRWLVTVFISATGGKTPVVPFERAKFLDKLNVLNPQPINVTWEVERKVIDHSGGIVAWEKKYHHTAVSCEVTVATQFLALMQIRTLYEKAFEHQPPKSKDEYLHISLADLTAEEILNAKTES